MLSYRIGYVSITRISSRAIMTFTGCHIINPFLYEANVTLSGVTIGAGVKMGRRTYMNDGTIRSGVEIGRYCSIGRRCAIGAFKHPLSWLSTHPIQGFLSPKAVFPPTKPTKIGNDVWIGDNTIVLDGVTVKDGAVLGAGSVVTRDVAPYAIVGGVPARLIRMRFDPETIERLLAVAWWNHDEEMLKGLPFHDIAAALEALERFPRIPDGERTYTSYGT